MRKNFIIIGVLILVLAAAGAFSFYRDNLRGVWPAIRKPSEDITKILDPENAKPGENKTAMPLKFPPGLSISIFAKNLGNPRVLAFDPQENLVVSIPGQGRVIALPDRNKDKVADEAIVIKSGLNRPHGIAFRCTEHCEMYIAESHQVSVFSYDQPFEATNGRKIIDLPNGGNHFSRTILFMPEPEDHRLLTSVGSSCNVCEERDSRRAKILVSNADGSDLKTFASGLRNAVFMAVHPLTQKIWVTEMGRDLLGDDLPPDEINIVEQEKNYGWPTCYGKNIHDTNFDPAPEQVWYGASKNTACEKFEPSYIDIPAHSAPLGLAFIPATPAWPEEYHNDLLVAYHGSWNRTNPTGYKVVRYKLDENGNYEGADSTGSPQVEDFITGWLSGASSSEGALGRPVDILVQPDGAMYISDDKAGVIYLVTYKK